MRLHALKGEVAERPKLFGNILGVLIAVVLISCGGLIAYDWIVPPVVVRAQELDHKRIQQGGKLCATFTVDRYRNCPAVVHQYIFDGKNTQISQLPLSVPSRPLVQGDPIDLCVTVPETAEPGRARYQMAFTHTCEVIDGWWSSRHTVAMPYLYFTIREPRKRVLGNPQDEAE